MLLEQVTIDFIRARTSLACCLVLGCARGNAMRFVLHVLSVHFVAPSPGNLFNWGPENNPSIANRSPAGALNCPNGCINQKAERSVSEGVQPEKHRGKRLLDFSAPMCPVRNSFHAYFQPLLLGKKGHSPKARSLQWALCKMLLISICQTAVSAGQCVNVSSFSSAFHGRWIMLETGQAAA